MKNEHLFIIILLALISLIIESCQSVIVRIDSPNDRDIHISDEK